MGVSRFLSDTCNVSKIFAAAFLAIGVLLATPSAQTATMPLDEVRPGMVGIGRTVFSGTTLEDFKVHILGVMRNVIGPKRSLILARLEGGPLAKTGVIAGMSGSPVYVDGRLIGAVSYSLGQFSTEADRRHHADRGNAGRDDDDGAGAEHAARLAVVAGDAARAARHLGRRSRPRASVR